MRQFISKKIKKSLVLALSACMVLTSMVMLPGSVYATDEGTNELTSLTVKGTTVDLENGSSEEGVWSYDATEKVLNITGSLDYSPYGSNATGVIEATGDLNISVGNNAKIQSIGSWDSMGIQVSGKLTIRGISAEEGSLNVEGPSSGISCGSLDIDIPGELTAIATYPYGAKAISSTGDVTIKTGGDLVVNSKGTICEYGICSNEGAVSLTSGGKIDITGKYYSFEANTGITLSSDDSIILRSFYTVGGDYPVSFSSSNGDITIEKVNETEKYNRIFCSDGSSFSAKGNLNIDSISPAEDEATSNIILKGIVPNGSELNVYVYGISDESKGYLTVDGKIYVDSGAYFPAGIENIEERPLPPVAQIVPKGSDESKTLYIDKYYKNDGTEGTSDNYNFYSDEDGLYVKDADIKELGLLQPVDANFIGDSTIGGIWSYNSQTLKGDNNATLKTDEDGIYIEGDLSIDKLDLTVDAEYYYGLEACSINANDSNIIISVKNDNTAVGISVDGGSMNVINSDIKINSDYNGILLDDGSLYMESGKLNINAINNGIHKGCIFIKGGTTIINGTKTDILADEVNISGGSLRANLLCKYNEDNEDDISTPLQLQMYSDAEAGYINVYKTVVLLENVSSAEKLTSLTTSLGEEYNTEDIYTDDQGKIYLYLPEGTSVSGAEIGNAIYKGNILTSSDNNASGTLAYQPIDISNAVVSGIVNKTYTGSSITQSGLIVKLGTKTLTVGTDYTVSYKNNKYPGTATVTITGKGNYSGSISKNFKISAPTLSAPSSVTNKLYGYDDIQVSWSKVSGASGYYVYYRKSTASSYTYKSYTTGTSMKIANLADGTKYYVRVIPYKTINGAPYKGNYKTSSAIYTLKKISTPKLSKKSSSKVTVKWTNISGESGYQISKSTSKTKTGTVYTFKTTTGKSKALSVKRYKTYYYKVRAYRTVGSKKIYGPWSSVKSYKLR